MSCFQSSSLAADHDDFLRPGDRTGSTDQMLQFMALHRTRFF